MTEQRVQRRKVFYLPGYDPFPPRRYRELYRRESALQAAISGYEIELSPLPEGRWQVASTQQGQEVVAEVEVLVWSDIVRASMRGATVGTYWALVRTAWIYLSTGALWRLMRMRKGPVIAALYPVVVLLMQLGASLLLAVAVVHLVAPPWLALPMVLVAIAASFWAWSYLDRWIYAQYLMRDYAHAAGVRGAYPHDLSKRLDQFVERVAAARQDDFDEVLLVGHSSGAYLGVTVLARLMRNQTRGAPVSFLSLGQVVPMVSALPEATELREDLATLGHQDSVFWLDVSAPGDGCAFALCDPVAVSGVGSDAQTGPVVLSARFSETLSPERWWALRWRFFRLHFQYLCAFDQPGGYDYFAITAGPQSLRARYGGRASSPSRLTRSVAP